MRHIVIGTAGHIDHGKSTLVQALTGIDPDRLKEEKARGITIDLGFAHCRLSAGATGATGETGETRVAFVDVPGHERFVRNMLAGATGIDAVLLVVSAEESVMPQTREHFAICRLLDVRAGVVALTKCDAAAASDADMIAIARSDVAELVAGSFLEGALVVEVSAKTGEGLDALRDAIVRVAAQAPSRATDGPMRLPIDRAFSMKGFGAVVTGTLVSGVLRVEDEVELLPAARRVRIRGLQVHGERVREAASGQRVAANLDGIDTSEIARGDLLATPGIFTPSTRFDCTFDLLADAKPLTHGTRVRVHHGTREALGRISIADIANSTDLIDASSAADASGAANASAGSEVVIAKSLSVSKTQILCHHDFVPGVVVGLGGRARARIRLETPMVVTRGDRFVLRAYSPVVTIGGGCVLDPQPPRGALRSAAARARFAALDVGVGGELLGAEATDRAALVMLDERGRDGLPLAMFVSRLGLGVSAVDAAAARLVRAGRAVLVGDLLVSTAVLDRLAAALMEQVTRHHQAQPDSEGLPREEARDRLGVAPRVFEHLVQMLAQSQKLHGRDRLALPTHRAAVPDADAAALARVEAAVLQSGLKPPDVGELARALTLPAATVERLVTLLVRQKRLVRIVSSGGSGGSSGGGGVALIFHPEALARLKDETRALKAGAPAGRAVVDVASFKSRYDVSRKYAIPLLEYLDRERITRRVGDERVVL
jgi:selenocysteine-specific elongation factor